MKPHIKLLVKIFRQNRPRDSILTLLFVYFTFITFTNNPYRTAHHWSWYEKHDITITYHHSISTKKNNNIRSNTVRASEQVKNTKHRNDNGWVDVPSYYEKAFLLNSVQRTVSFDVFEPPGMVIKKTCFHF